ncbi:hypothetical protein ACFXCZ_04490 [Streptomyces sp. NPDC059396]|uniref:hypothetical protein n=1 Tax=Streptomyces sp. NPDC059396 TaxID=3346819 RepID=UPI00367FE978
MRTFAQVPASMMAGHLPGPAPEFRFGAGRERRRDCFFGPLGSQFATVLRRGNAAVTSPALIVVSGSAGSGKTTLAHEIVRSLGCPAVCRDEIKEGMVHSTPGF